MTRWKLFFPLMHDPFNKRFVKMVARVQELKLERATIDDIMEAFDCDRKTAKHCYETGDSPAWADILSRAHAHEKGKKAEVKRDDSDS